MTKDNLIQIINYLNCRQKAFLVLANNQENSFFHLSEIIFSVVKEELYNGDLSIIDYCIKVSIKKTGQKKRRSKTIIPDNITSINELYDWDLPNGIRIEIFDIIAEFSNTIIYNYKTDTLIPCRARGIIIKDMNPFNNEELL